MFANSIHGFSSRRLGEKESQDVNLIIEKTISQLQPTLAANELYKHVSLELCLAREPLKCLVFETPLIQVFRNIVLNAYEAMERSKNARLTISSSKADHQLARIVFVDTGGGIKDEFRTRVFDPDFSTKSRGSGIGLWLAKTHLGVINAKIGFRSAVNEGTAFTIEIPLAGD